MVLLERAVEIDPTFALAAPQPGYSFDQSNTKTFGSQLYYMERALASPTGFPSTSAIA